MMRHARCLSFLLLMSCVIAREGTAAPVEGQTANIPDLLYRNDPDMKYPMWVALGRVFRQDGAIDPVLFPANSQQTIKELLASPTQDGCVRAGAYTVDIINPPQRSNLKEAVASARLILLAKVADRAYGFEGGTPGQLLRVVPEETLKGTARNVDAYFVFMPVGDFKLASKAICKTDGRYPGVPAVGEEVVLFVPTVWFWSDQDPYLELLDDAGIVTVKADSSLGLPRRYREHTPQAQLPATREDLLQAIAQYSSKEK